MSEYVKKSVMRIAALVVSGLLLFAAGLLAGRFLTGPDASKDSQPSPNAQEGQMVGAVEDANTLSPNAVVVWKYRYSECDEEYVEEKPPEAAIVGMKAVDIARYYADYELESFTRTSVVLTCEIAQVCPRHILVRLQEDGRAGLYRTMPGTDEMRLETTVSLDTDRLGAEELERLKEGILFDSTAQMEAFFEDVGT